MNSKNSAMLTSVIYILLGVLLCIFKSTVLNWLLTAAGIYFTVIGIVELIRRNIPAGIFSVALGVLIILGGWLFVEIILIVCGIASVIRGILLLISAAEARAPLGMLYAVITLVLGILLILSKWVMLNWFFVIIGIIFIADGISALISAAE
ncbi:MAG: DUF308 domain-containing protein [Clostridia bacterium]|nr:DUF308 domain-containing protein [Clostridia bacterium]